jgi:N-acetylneuraminic acid mutarotase
MHRRLTIVSTVIVFASIAGVYGCSSESISSLVPHAGAVSDQVTRQSTGSWSSKASMPTPRYGLSVDVVNGTLYAIGGIGRDYVPVSTVEAYDPATDSWSEKTSMPTARCFFASGVVNGILYAVGGYDDQFRPLNTVEAYDSATDTWSAKTSMPTARTGLAVSVVNKILYAIGGTRRFSPLNIVEAYDPATDSWTTRASMPKARKELAATALGHKLYAVGGTNNGARHTDQAYDAATDTWTNKAPMPTARFGLAASDLNGVLYAVGGCAVFCNYRLPSLNTVEAFNPSTNTWHTKAPMPTARAWLAAGVVNGILYAVGGFETGPAATVEAYNPQ